MAVTHPKRTLTKDEIIDILRRNARLFKDEPEFVNYIVDLAMYLIEQYLDRGAEKQAPFRATAKEIKDVYKAFEKFTGSKTPARICPICGSFVEGKRRCPNCNGMTF